MYNLGSHHTRLIIKPEHDVQFDLCDVNVWKTSCCLCVKQEIDVLFYVCDVRCGGLSHSY